MNVVGSLISGGRHSEGNASGGNFMVTMVLQLVLGFFASAIVAWFSRQREFRADAGSAQLMGNPRNMIAALQRLGGMHAEGQHMPKNLAAMGIAGSIGQLFSTHPPMEARIAALQAMGR